MTGFSRAIGITTSVGAELWAVRDGLQLASDLRITTIQLKIDAQYVANMLNGKSNDNLLIDPILHDSGKLCPKPNPPFIQTETYT